MKKHFGYAATMATIMAATAPLAQADTATSGGGLKISSSDGEFEGTLGGRLHYDYASFSDDQIEDASTDGFYLRRAYLSLAGKLYGFEYKLETDLSSDDPAGKDMWIGHELFGGFVKLGHMQPAYGMEERTSSNDVLFAERPFISNNTLFSGREYQNGISYEYAGAGFTAMAVYYNVNTDADKNASSAADGNGESVRLTYAPISGDRSTLHVGLSYDIADYDDVEVNPSPTASARYVGRNGPRLALVGEGYDKQQTSTLELAGSYGPFFVQGEYSLASYETDGAADQDLTAYYVQASWFATGETKPYKRDKGVFSNPKASGALEFKLRYDFIKNDDAAGEPEATTVSAGVNYYFNPKVRFMLDYNIGSAEAGADVDDDPSSVVARAQLAF